MISENQNLIPAEHRGQDNHESWSDLLGKYVEVWIFSIQFGMLSTVTFSFTSSRYIDSERWGMLGIPLILLAFAGTTAVVASWYMLLRYFTRCLIPRFVLKREQDAELSSQAAHYLGFAMNWTVMAALFEATSCGAEGVVRDISLLPWPWRICLSAIKIPVACWQGSCHYSSPPQTIDFLRGQISNLTATRLQREGHLTILDVATGPALDWLQVEATSRRSSMP